MIVFINCYEEMATGMRMLAAQAHNEGFPVHIIILHGYTISISKQLNSADDTMHVCINSSFHSHPCRLRQFTAEELNLLREELLRLGPELICISTRSANDGLMPGLLQSIREACPGIPIACGGYGPTYAPEFYLRSGADVVLRGEGEVAFPELLDNLRQKRPLQHCPNASYLDQGHLVSRPLTPPLRNIENLPSPLTGDNLVTFITKDEQGHACALRHDPAFDKATFNILIGRGCIGQCSYCAAPVLRMQYAKEGHMLPRYRRRSYEQVLEELEEAKAHGVKRIFIKDEYLVDSPEKLTDFFLQYKERIALPFRANLHSDQLLRSQNLREAALDAGLYSYTIGFQAGTESMARQLYNRPHSFTVLKELARLLSEQFVSVQYHFVSGTTLNSPEEFQAKCQLLSSLPYSPQAPSLTLAMDFQFFPQPLSCLSQQIGEKHLQRLPLQEWAALALRAQLRHFAAEEDCLQAEEEALAQQDPIAFLQQRSMELRIQAQEKHYQAMARQLAGRDILVMGEATPVFEQRKHVLSGSRIAGFVAFPGRTAAGRLDVEDIAAHWDASTPIILFDTAFYRFARMLRRRYRLKNPIFAACASLGERR